MMYNIADFLRVQLSLGRFTLIKSERSSHVCLNYISTAQFSRSDNQIININTTDVDRPHFFRLIFGWTFFGGDFG